MNFISGSSTELIRTINKLMHNVAISIIIPTYNRTIFLERAIRSVLMQTLPAYEIIIVDDGSDAKYLPELRRISQLSANISLHHLPANSGVSQARNYGIIISRGNYLLFLDDDDAIHPEMFETAASAFKESDKIDIVIFGCNILSENKYSHDLHQIYYLFCYKDFANSPIRRWLDKLHKTNQINELEKNPFSVILKSCPAINACLIRKDAIGNCVFQKDLVFGEDWYFWLSLAYKGCRFKAKPNYYAYVQRHDNNTTRSTERFYHNITNCLKRVVESGMLKSREDRFNIQARFLLAYFKKAKLVDLRELFFIIKAPHLALKLLLCYLFERL
ncbi:MAG: glycosyltransferase [Acidobacteriota bacterium]